MGWLYFDDLRYNRFFGATTGTVAFTGTSQFGGNCLSILTTNPEQGFNIPIQELEDLTVGVYCRRNDFSGSHYAIFAIRDGTDVIAAVRIAPNGYVQIWNEQNETPYSTLALKEDNWHHFEMSCQIIITPPTELDPDGSTSINVILKINNVQYISASMPLDFAVDPADNVLLSNNNLAGGTADLFSNFVVHEGLTIVGDSRVLTLDPDANGASQDWTPNTGVNHFDKINELNKDDDTTYLGESVTVGEEMNTHENTDVQYDVIKGLQVALWAKKTISEGTKFLQMGAREGAVNRYGAGIHHPFVGAYTFHHEPFEFNPQDGLAWLQTEVDADEFGFKYTT